jgi:hypothetical protein
VVLAGHEVRDGRRFAVLVESELREVSRFVNQAAVVICEDLARVDPAILADPRTRPRTVPVLPG